jgi:hypothetical protein
LDGSENIDIFLAGCSRFLGSAGRQGENAPLSWAGSESQDNIFLAISAQSGKHFLLPEITLPEN